MMHRFGRGGYQRGYDYGGRGGSRGRGGYRGSEFEDHGSDRYASDRSRTPVSRAARHDPGPHALPAVKQELHFIKRQTLPYISKNGSILNHTNRSTSDAEVLTIEHISLGLTFLNSEPYNGRLAHWVSFLAGNHEAAATLVHELVPTEGELTEAGRDKFRKTGLFTMAKFYRSQEGETFLQAARILNLKNEGEDRAPDVLDKVLKDFFSILPKFERSCQNIILFCSKLLATAGGTLEALAAVSNRDRMADQLTQQSPQHTPEVKQFCRQPHDDQHLVNAIVSRYMLELQPRIAQHPADLLQSSVHDFDDAPAEHADCEDGRADDLYRAAAPSRTSMFGRTMTQPRTQAPQQRLTATGAKPQAAYSFGGRSENRYSQKPPAEKKSLFQDSEDEETDEYAEARRSFEGWEKDSFEKAFASYTSFKKKVGEDANTVTLDDFKAALGPIPKEVLQAFDINIKVSERRRLPSDLVGLVTSLNVVYAEARKHFVVA